MTTIDFPCAGCGKWFIGMTFKFIWYALGKPCCSRKCQRRVIEAARGVATQDLIREDEAQTA